MLTYKKMLCYNLLACLKWALSSAGRASRLHREGQEFEPPRVHHLKCKEPYGSFFIFYIHVIIILGDNNERIYGCCN